MKSNCALVVLLSLAMPALYASSAQNAPQSGTKKIVFKGMSNNSILELPEVSDTQTVQTLREHVAREWKLKLEVVTLMIPKRNMMFGRHLADATLVSSLPSNQSIVSLLVVTKQSKL